MPRTSQILSLSMPPKFAQLVEKAAAKTHQTKSELMRQALRSYLLDLEEDRLHFLQAYTATRQEPFLTLHELKQRLDLD